MFGDGVRDRIRSRQILRRYGMEMFRSHTEYVEQYTSPEHYDAAVIGKEQEAPGKQSLFRGNAAAAETGWSGTESPIIRPGSPGSRRIFSLRRVGLITLIVILVLSFGLAICGALGIQPFRYLLHQKTGHAVLENENRSDGTFLSVTGPVSRKDILRIVDGLN